MTLQEAIDQHDGGEPLQARIIWAIATGGPTPTVVSVYRAAHFRDEWETPGRRIDKDEFSEAVRALVLGGYCMPVQPDRIRLVLDSPDAIFQVACSGTLPGGGKCLTHAEPQRGRDAAKKSARAAGWTIQGNAAYCPACAAKRPQLVPFVPRPNKKARRAERRQKGPN